MKNTIMFFFALSLFVNHTQGQEKTDPDNQPEELGKVSWLRDYDDAIALAKKEDKTILILFQEVPGCSTCRNYGHNVLSHPLMVDAIENLFVPLAIYNNKKGKDGKILKQFGEPAWNNPVVRIINSDGDNLVKRVSGNYAQKGLYQAMEKALTKEGKPIPKFMQLLKQENGAVAKEMEEIYFKMYCFWSGESHLGNADGVVATEAGFMDGHEVVKVNFASEVISKVELVAHAKNGNCSVLPKKGAYRKDKDPQYYLKNSPYKYLPLTAIQKTKINSALHNNINPENYLSPTQLKWLTDINSYNPKKVLWYDSDFVKGWTAMVQSTVKRTGM